MLGHRENINRLFSEDVQYQVPHYQRRYVWNKTNWRTLWEDVLAELGLELEEKPDDKYDFKPLEQREDISAEDKKHFTGIIVIRLIKRERWGLQIFEVIDGQQRLTTFQIILCVIRDILESKGHSKQAEGPQELLMSESAGIESQKFVPTEYDKLAFKSILDGRYGRFISEYFDDQSNCLSLDEVEHRSLHLQLKQLDRSSEVSDDIFGVYDYFYEWIRRYASKNDLINLLSIIRNKFDFAMITIDESDYSEEIFESLNATGRKLSDFDYLRNNLFLRARQLSDFFYKKYWIFEKDERDFHYWQTHRQERFLRAFLKANLGPYCFRTENVKPLDVYRKYSIKTNGIENEFKQLKAYAEAYRKLNKDMDDHNTSIYRYVKFFSDFSLIFSNLSLTRLDPLILYVKVTHENDDSAVDGLCKILESYLVRRMFCLGDEEKDTYADVNTASHNRIEYFFNNSVKEGEFNVDKFRQFLSEAPAIWPDNQQVETAFENVRTKRLEFIHYIFQRLEHHRSSGSMKPWEFSPLTLDKHGSLSQQLRNGESLTHFNELWECPLNLPRS